MVKNIKEDVKDDLYDEPGVVGSLGGVAPYAKAQKISIAQGKKELEKKLSTQISRHIAQTCQSIQSHLSQEY